MVQTMWPVAETIASPVRAQAEAARAAWRTLASAGDPQRSAVLEHVARLLVERQDPEALGAAIAAVLRDPERAAEMGRRGRERQRAEFDLDVMVERIGRLYEELFERSRRGRQEAWTAERKSSAIRAS